MTQTGAILEVLKDGKEHSVAEIHRRAGTSRLNSRISDLRRHGHVIRCFTVKGRTNAERYVYQLLYSLTEPGVAPRERHMTAPGSVSEFPSSAALTATGEKPGRSMSSSDEPADARQAIPLDSPPAGQMSLEMVA